jgi:hypothetical protein
MVKEQILLVYSAIGPTYRQRLLYNIKQYPSYNFYDILIITDFPEDFADLRSSSNIFIEDIDILRNRFSWSYDLERIPKEKIDETAYVKEIQNKNIKLPLALRRFASEWKNIYNYRGIVFLDCDTFPKGTYDEYLKAIDFIYRDKVSIPEKNIYNQLINNIIGIGFVDDPGYDQYHTPFLMEYAEQINNKYNITDKPIINRFPISDGPFRAYRFPNEESMKQFFNLIHNILQDNLVHKMYPKITEHCIWTTHVEYLLSIVTNLMDITVNSGTYSIGINKNSAFKVECYPEDRFWCFSAGFTNSTLNKLDFVKNNYEKLKTFYSNNSQHFPY